MKITNSDLQASLSKMMGKGSPLNAIIQEQKPTKQAKAKRKANSKSKANTKKQPIASKPSQSTIRPKSWRDFEDDEPIILKNFTFIFNNRPFEATLRHNTVNLLDLSTYQSSITYSLWDDEATQHLHDYLQRNWELLEVHGIEEASHTTFLVDEAYHMIPIKGVTA